MEQTHSVDDVYGVTRDLPLNYVTRPKVDEDFVVHLAQRRNIVVFGSSKQGKTSLRKKCLQEDDYIVVSASNKWTLGDLNASILKESGFRTELSSTRAYSGHAKLTLKAAGKGGIPLLAEAKGEAALEADGTIQQQSSTVALEIDPLDPNDIIRALDSLNFGKYIVIEDFHYLPEETQKDFSFALKAYHENSQLCFVIVGVWREKNRLIGFNGDLTERVISIDVDTWDPDQLREVVRAGEALLNVSFDDAFVDSLISNSFQSVHLVQEVCRRTCRKANVFSTQEKLKSVGEGIDAKDAVREVVADQSGRYMGFLQNISDGFQETSKEMPRWVIYAILKSSISDLRDGLRLKTINKLIREKHPDGEKLNAGNVTQILKTFSSLQAKKNVRPIVADYDTQNRSLYIVDRGFEIWLENQDRNDLLEELGLPAA